ncbi:unnamed protein product [Calicophoron daubneyi]|uniref:Late endosomal/lysosomal adaptor and MAPK and MTOR activator 5 n=1 Tax=Calicophoron daubneyi TaxID=300641 RepID=A0AAV2TJY3_CALDB
METALEEHLASVQSQPGVTGVQCIDVDGLCLASRGCTNELTCGLLTSVYKHIQDIEEEDEKESPVVVIEQSSGSIVLCEADGILTAIHKAAT